MNYFSFYPVKIFLKISFFVCFKSTKREKLFVGFNSFFVSACVCVCFSWKWHKTKSFSLFFFGLVCPSPFFFKKFFGCSESQCFLCFVQPHTQKSSTTTRKRRKKNPRSKCSKHFSGLYTLLFSYLFSLHLLFIYLYITYFNVNMFSESTTTNTAREETTQFQTY